MSGQEAAKLIRKELKAAFPNIKFSVRSDYSAVDIGWKDGPTKSQIDAIVGKYEMGRFDGMTDCYDYSNRREDIPQCRYVFANREIDAAIREKVAAHHASYFGDWERLTDYERNRRINETLYTTAY